MAPFSKHDPAKVSAVRTYLAAHPEAGGRSVGKAFGIPHASACRLVRQLKAEKASEQSVPALGARQNTTDRSVELVTENPSNLDDLLKVCRVDLTKFKVSRFVVNKWEVGTRLDSGKVLRTPLFQIKAFLDEIPGLQDAKAMKDAMEWVRTQVIVPRKPAKVQLRALGVADPHLLEISIFDSHGGKLVWGEENGGSNYDLSIMENLYTQASQGLWDRASVFPIQRILLPIGNDLLNVDNEANTTAAGTQQQEDGRHQRSFRRVAALIRGQIESLRGKTPEGIDVLIIPGNHDLTRAWYLGELLRAVYEKTPDVRINNSPNPRKYYRYGATLLGFTHGHAEKHASLPLIMAGEAAKDWADTSHHEFHLGHLHHSRETRFHAGQEIGPVRIRILPSLTSADSWHHSHGYVLSQRAAEAYLWSFKNGYSGHLSWNCGQAKAA